MDEGEGAGRSEVEVGVVYDIGRGKQHGVADARVLCNTMRR